MTSVSSSRMHLVTLIVAKRDRELCMKAGLTIFVLQSLEFTLALCRGHSMVGAVTPLVYGFSIRVAPF